MVQLDLEDATVVQFRTSSSFTSIYLATKGYLQTHSLGGPGRALTSIWSCAPLCYACLEKTKNHMPVKAVVLFWGNYRVHPLPCTHCHLSHPKHASMSQIDTPCLLMPVRGVHLCFGAQMVLIGFLALKVGTICDFSPQHHCRGASSYNSVPDFFGCSAWARCFLPLRGRATESEGEKEQELTKE